MMGYIKPMKKNFSPDIHTSQVGTDDLTLSKTPEQIAKHIFDIVSSLKTDSDTVIVSNIVPTGNNNKGKTGKSNSSYK